MKSWISVAKLCVFDTNLNQSGPTRQHTAYSMVVYLFSQLQKKFPLLIEQSYKNY